MDANYKKWRNHELSAIEFMRKLDLKKNTFYKVIKEFESQHDML